MNTQFVSARLHMQTILCRFLISRTRHDQARTMERHQKRMPGHEPPSKKIPKHRDLLTQRSEKSTSATALLLRLGARQCLGASHSEVEITRRDGAVSESSFSRCVATSS